MDKQLHIAITWISIGFLIGFAMNWILPFLYKKLDMKNKTAKWKRCLNSKYAKYNNGE